MAKLKRDERVCPYCAETIKAAATRCRYCQSDVTPVTDPAAPPVESTPKKKSAPAVEAESTPIPVVEKPRPADDRTIAPKWLTTGLAALVIVAAVGVGVSWWRAEQESALVGDEARTDVLVSAADLTQRTLSYNYKTLAADMETARARMTPAFRKEYESTMAQVRGNTAKNKIVLQATAVSTAIIDATEHKATVLVFANQTTSAGGKNQQLTRNSLVVTLTRGEGDWAISKLTALG